MNIRVIFIFILLSMAITIKAQQLEVVFFEEPIAELGTIMDDQGVVSHRFTFTNHTADSLEVEKVTASCGCTSTNWSIDPIRPGDKGYVEVEFDPFNRPGSFEKTVVVHYKGQQDSILLQINGFVEPASESIIDAFPEKMGALRAKHKSFDLGTITKRSLFSKSFEVYNEGDQILVFADDMEGPNHITVTFEPYTLNPRSKGKIWVHYDVRETYQFSPMRKVKLARIFQ